MSWTAPTGTGSTQCPGGNTGGSLSNPSGSVAGDIVIQGIYFAGTKLPSWSTGWTLVAQVTQGANRTASVAARILDGGANDACSVSWTGNEQWARQAYRIPAGQHKGTLPQGQGGGNGGLDVGSFSPSWGSKETMWIAIFGHDTASETINGIPTDFTAIMAETTGANSICAGIQGAYRVLTTASLDPSAWSLTGSFTNGGAIILAIEPADAAPPSNPDPTLIVELQPA